MSKDADNVIAPPIDPSRSTTPSSPQPILATITAESHLPDDPDTLKGMIRELLDLLRSRDRELDSVRHRLDQLLRRLYGPKGEKFRPDQPGLFDLLNEIAKAEATPPEAVVPPPVQPQPMIPQPRKGHGRRPLPTSGFKT